MDITPVIKIDHAAIGLSLYNSYESVKGPGFWKMNVSNSISLGGTKKAPTNPGQ